MNYFSQLLESYDKLKKRKLRLVEEESPQDDGVAAAQQALAAAQSQAPPPTFHKPYVVNAARSTIGIYLTSNGPKAGWKFGVMGSDGKPGRSYPVEDPRFPGFFATEGIAEPKNTNPNKGAEPGQVSMQSELAIEDQEAMAEVQADFLEMATKIEELMGSLSPKQFKKFKKAIGKEDITPSLFGNYIFGARPQSIEKQIVGKNSRFTKIGNEFIEIPEPVDPYTAKSVTKNLKQLIDIITNNNTDSIADKYFVGSNFALGVDGTVSIFSDTEDSGLVFKDDTGFLKLLVNSAAERYNLKLKPISYNRNTGGVGEANTIRGTLFEEILPWVALASKVNMNRKLGLDTSKLEASTKKLFNSLREKIGKLRDLQEAWTLKFSSQALEPNEKELLDELTTYAGKDSHDLIRSMVKISQEALIKRKPDFFIPVGQLTGNGERADVLECHADYENAKRSLTTLGYTDEDISKGMIMETTLKELKAGNALYPEIEDVIKSNGIFGSNQPIYYIPTSLKNYMTLSEIKAGTSTISSFKKFVGEGLKNQFFAKGAENLPNGISDADSVIKYDSALEKVYQGINSLGAMQVKSASGEKKKINSLKDVTKNIISSLKKSNTFEELYGQSAIIDNTTESELIKYMEKLNSTEEESKDFEVMTQKAVQIVSTYLKNKKLQLDIQAGDKAAKNFLNMKLWNCAGCVKEGTLVDARALNSRASFSFMQNDVIRSIMNSVNADSGEWSMEFKGNYIHFVNNSNPKAKVILSDKVQKRVGNSYYSATTQSFFNEHTMKMFNRIGFKPSKESIEEMINIQRKLFQAILNRE